MVNFNDVTHEVERRASFEIISVLGKRPDLLNKISGAKETEEQNDGIR